MKIAIILTFIVMGGLLIALPVAVRLATRGDSPSIMEGDFALTCQISGIVMAVTGAILSVIALIMERCSKQP